MDKYVANPVAADAAVIEDIRNIAGFPEVYFDGLWVRLPEGAGARYEPQKGDYYVRQEDGYVYVNPKHVFERKYTPIVPVTTSLLLGNTQAQVPPAGVKLAGDIETLEQAKAAGLPIAPNKAKSA